LRKIVQVIELQLRNQSCWDSVGVSTVRMQAVDSMSKESSIIPSRSRRFCCSPQFPVCVWSLPSLLFSGYSGLFTGACSWPLTSLWCKVEAWMEL